MKTTTYLNNTLFLFLLILSSQLFAQNIVPFTPRFTGTLKGDIRLIGNNILGPHRTNAFDDPTAANSNENMIYIDIDNDPSTFSSSSADLVIPNPDCHKIIHAGLYWSAATLRPVGASDDITRVKLKGPSGSYQDVQGTVVYNSAGSLIDDFSSPYVCFADVTSIVDGLNTRIGTYTVANIISNQGMSSTIGNPVGYSAGWSLYVVYEDPTLSGKLISSFDGFSTISSTTNASLDVVVSGFKTVPAPLPVRANFAFAALEGDSPIPGDQLKLNGINLSTTDRPVANFFNSSITQLSAQPVNNRNPNSSNTLGFDTGIIRVVNTLNQVIPNDATSATVRLETTGDTYFPYFFALAIDVIEPKVILTKTVEDAMGNDIGNNAVALGTELNYVLGFQNIGNDNAKDYVIRDILPFNIDFDYPADIGTLPAGITHTYNPGTRQLVFTIDDSLVEIGDPVYEIRFKVSVVTECSLLNNVCSNLVLNQAFSTYRGDINPDFIISDDPEPSFNMNTGCLITPGLTNFLADLDCVFEEEVILCGGGSVQLTAGDGYESYSWSRNPSGTPVIATTQSITVEEEGTYYSANTAFSPCLSITEAFEVVTFGAVITNPVIPFVEEDEVSTCPNDGRKLPNIFLCGGNGPRVIETNITDTNSIIWEKLDESSCPAIANTDCANEGASCIWNEVATGPNYTVNTAGQFRLTLNYDGGCFNQYYFNAYANPLVPDITFNDIYCDTPGEIIVGGIPDNYQYSIDSVNFQESNVFSITTPNIYTVYIRQNGVDPNPCVFTVPNIQIRERNFTVSRNIENPLCHGNLGSISIAANDVRAPYFFSISQGGTLVNSVGPINSNTHTFSNLNPGTYSIAVSTNDTGCTYTEDDLEIIEPPLFELTSALTTPLTSCSDGEITMFPTGGTPPYSYFIDDGSFRIRTVPTIPITTPGTFDVIAADSNNCPQRLSITVDAILVPEFTVIKSDIACFNTGDSGEITIDVTNANGNTLAYSIDNGATFSNSNVFTGLSNGDYDVVVSHTVDRADTCFSTPERVTINTLARVTGTATLTTPFSCDSDGVITVSGASGGATPYSYSLDGVNFQGTTTFTGLTEGSHTVTIRDFNGCTFVVPPIVIEGINPPTDLDFSIPSTCSTLMSDVTLTATNGILPLEYQIIAPSGLATAYQDSSVFQGLSPDTYTFQVRDAKGCLYSETYTLATSPPITINTVVTKGLDCTASPDGVITATIMGGLAPFSYAVSFNGGSYSGSTSVTGSSFMYTATTGGTYQFQITDANSCIAQSGVQTINPISLPNIISVSQTESILCQGDSNAIIEVIIDDTVGTPPFTLNVNNDTASMNFGTQTSGLSAGDYTITLTDANSCIATAPITISEPNAIDFSLDKVDITCDSSGGSSSLGAIIVENVTGGVGPFTYHITNNFGDTIMGSPYVATSNEDHTFDVINFGIYTVNVVDANGCSLAMQETIASPPEDLTINITPVAPDCSTGGEVIVEAVSTVGSGNYEFAILEMNTSPYAAPGSFLPADPGFPNQRTFTNLTPGVVFTFVVHDLTTGCFFVKSADAAIAPASTLTSVVTPTPIRCQGEDNGSVTFTIDNFDATTSTVDYEIFRAFTNTLISGPTNISVTAGTPETVTTPEALSPGQYYIRFTENGSGSFNGCESASAIFEIRESIVPLSIDASVTKDANCNPNSGVITAIARGGTAPYLYQLTTSATPPLATDASWNSSSTFNANANSYFVHALDDFGCIVSTPVIMLPLAPAPTISAILKTQCDIREGEFEIDVDLTSPGIAPYSYSIDGGAFQTMAAPFTISNLSSGTHTVAIQDANGCGNSVSVIIAPPLEVVPEVTARSTCNNNDGEITLTATGGGGMYTYSISPSVGAMSGNVFSALPSGTYIIRVTETVTSCFKEVSVVIPEALRPTITTTPTAILCFGDNDGTFELSVNGYSGPYTYEVFDETSTSVSGVVATNTLSDPEEVLGLGGGTYSVVITETTSPFCSVTSSVSISSPIAALVLDAQETSSVTCDNDKGVITATATGGWGTYEYELTGDVTIAYSSNGVFRGLSAGNYTVNVRDAGGCIVSENVPLSLPAPIVINIVPPVPVLACFGDTNASISAMATGGQGSNYTYTLNMTSPTVSSSGPQTSPIFSGLGQGTYNIMVRDGYSCSATSTSITILEPTPIEVNLVKATSQTCTMANATLRLSASGGTGRYEYSDTASFSTILGDFAMSTTFPVSAGTYNYYVRDANGCVSNISNDITVEPLLDLSVNLDVKNAVINCAGDANGIIIASAEGGLGNYVYTLQDSSGTPSMTAVQSSPGAFTNIPVGDYQVEVTSGDCIEVSSIISITNAAAPLNVGFNAIDVSCNGENNGMLEITVDGGFGAIKYAITPQLNRFIDLNLQLDPDTGEFIHTIEGLAPVVAPNTPYTVVVQDELGCFVTHSFSISEPPPLGITHTISSEAPCNGDLTGEFTINILGGEPPYSVSLDNVTYTAVSPTVSMGVTTHEHTFSGLEGGEKQVYILDSANCGGDSPFSIPLQEPANLSPLASVEYGCTNDAANNTNTVTNRVTITVHSSITDTSGLEYALDGGPFSVGTDVYNNLAVGPHRVQVRHPNGCVQVTDEFTIDAFDPLSLVLNDGNLNEIVAEGSGGEPPYEYRLDEQSYGNENSLFIFESRDYTVTVRDANGCEFSVTRFFEFVNVCIPNYFTPNGDGNLDGWGPGCAGQYEKLTLQVFDRYGRKITVLKLGDTWDGKYKGVELPSGDYWYILKLNEPRNNRDFVGHFTLYR